ncbi:MAG: hypothetical protein D6788_03090, partial [Planctomycetota bacterium]
VLANLHRIDPLEGLPAFGTSQEMDIVRRWAETLAVLEPETGSTAGMLAGGLEAFSAEVPAGRPCVLHRDFYERQFTLGREGITLMDLDTLAVGDPAVDWGNFLAHLVLMALADEVPATEAVESVREALAVYETAAGDLHASSLRFYWASSLFRVGAVHVLRTNTRRFSPALWALAARLLHLGEGWPPAKTKQPDRSGDLPAWSALIEGVT